MKAQRMIKNLNALRNVLIVFMIFLFGNIIAQPVASFTADTTQGCAGQLLVNFSNTSTGATSYLWDFGDNSTPVNTTNPSRLFSVAGTKTITLVASDGVSTDTARLTINVFRLPTPDFTVSKDSVCVNERVNVTGQVVLGDAPLVQCFWDFGTVNPSVTYQTCSDTFFNYPKSGCYQISYFVVDANGCFSNVIKPNAVCVRRQPIACFDISTYNPCRVSPQSISFTNCSSHENPGIPIGYQWSFGSSAANPPARNFSCGEDTVKLRANDASGCFTEAVKVVKINCVNSGFTMATNTPCKGASLQFTNTSTGTPNNPPTDVLTYSWLFQCPNSASTLRDPSHTFTQNGTCTIRLIATLNGCRDTTFSTVTVSDSIPTDFTAPQAQKCVPPLTVNFTKTTTGGTNCLWDFGDAVGTSPLCNPTYVYNSMGCHDVTLQVSNPSGCMSRVTKKDFVCIQSFDAEIGADVVSGCAPLTVNFTDATQVAQQIVDCKWNFGLAPGVSSNDCDPPAVTYNTPGNYNVWLRVQTADGCFDTVRRTISVTPKPTADFVANPLTNCIKKPTVFTCLCSGGTTYNWDFGAGTSTSTLQNPTWYYDEEGPHTVTLTVSQGKCSTVVTKVNYVTTLLPKAEFIAPRACGSASTINFTSESIGADSIWWEFGDGTFGGNVTSITHTYPNTNTYTPILFVKNFATGCIDSIAKKISFTSASNGFKANRTNICSGRTVSFTDTSAFGTTWLWSFGDGQTSTLKNPTHKYDTVARRYTVKLIIDKGTPCEDSVVRVNYITVNKPIAEFTADKTRGCRPLTVQFTDQSQANYAPISKWQWRFNNSAFDTTQNPTRTFNGTQPNINVLLIVTDSVGCIDSMVKTNYIRPTIISPNFNISSPRCPGKPITFTNTTPNSAGYDFYWDFGDGDTTNLRVNATHTYATNDSFSVKLTAVHKTLGCSAAVVKIIDVAGVGVDFTAIRNFPCPPAPVIFQNLTPDSGLQVSYKWYFGNGRSSFDRDPPHPYFFPGSYDVTLVGTLPNGCKDSLIKKNYINILGPRLENVVFDPPFGCRPLTVNFSGKIYETQTGTLIWTNGVDTTLNITYGDTVYFNSSHSYHDATIDTGFIKPVLILEDDKGCRVPYPLIDSIYVDEYPHPNQRDTSICIGATVEYTLPDGDFFLWESSDSATYLTCDTCSFVVSSAQDTITYYVTATTKWGCVAKDTITLSVEDIPHLDAGPDFKLCRTETRVLPVGDVYNALWTPSTYLSSPTSISPTITATQDMTWVIYSENRLGNRPGCFIYDTLNMRVIDTVVVTPPADTAICIGEKTILDLTVVDASINDTTYFWFPEQYLDNNRLEDPTATPPFSMPFTVVVRSPLCFRDSQTVFVRVDPLPEIELYQDTVIAVGTELDLAALSNDAITYEWSSRDPLSCDDCTAPTLTAVFSQWVHVTVTNQFGCKATDSAYIKVLPCTPDFVFVPTAFTPNGDGLNDILYARGKALVEIKTFIVSNRWGNVMYSSNNIKEGWDGTFRGQLAPTDAYVWYVKGICTNGEEVEKKGNITLIR
jgi:gliding motility-associated-like protein